MFMIIVKDYFVLFRLHVMRIYSTLHIYIILRIYSFIHFHSDHFYSAPSSPKGLAQDPYLAARAGVENHDPPVEGYRLKQCATILRISLQLFHVVKFHVVKFT